MYLWIKKDIQDTFNPINKKQNNRQLTIKLGNIDYMKLKLLIISEASSSTLVEG
jgi:hypothetical protein